MPSRIAEFAGYSRQHLLRLRQGVQVANQRNRQKVVAAVQRFEHGATEDNLFEPEVLESMADAIRVMGKQCEPTDRMASTLAAAPASEATVRAGVDVAERLLDRSPTDALALFHVSERIIRKLVETPPLLVSALQGHVARGTANALRMVGDYHEALNQLNDAQQHFLDAQYCGEELGRVQLSRSGILFKMERWTDAAQAAAHARQLFEVARDTKRLIHARVMAGCIAIERGELDGGRRTFLEIERLLARRRLDAHTQARVWMNLATCELRRGESDAAREWLIRARGAFTRLGMLTELPRTEWCEGRIMLLEGKRAPGLRRLRAAMRRFLALQMPTDAAFVGLDLLAVVVDIGAPAAATRLANELVTIFTRAGTAVSTAQAMAHLRDAVIARSATPALVRYVENYVRRLDVEPSTPFLPSLN